MSPCRSDQTPSRRPGLEHPVSVHLIATAMRYASIDGEFLCRAGGLAGLGLVSCTDLGRAGRLPWSPDPGSPVAAGRGDRRRHVRSRRGLRASSGRATTIAVLEARDRVGGRVLTLRSPFAPGHSAEAGAARIPPEHDLTLGYARHFGLELDRFYPESGLLSRRSERGADPGFPAVLSFRASGLREDPERKRSFAQRLRGGAGRTRGPGITRAPRSSPAAPCKPFAVMAEPGNRTGCS